MQSPATMVTEILTGCKIHDVSAGSQIFQIYLWCFVFITSLLSSILSPGDPFTPSVLITVVVFSLRSFSYILKSTKQKFRRGINEDCSWQEFQSIWLEQEQNLSTNEKSFCLDEFSYPPSEQSLPSSDIEDFDSRNLDTIGEEILPDTFYFGNNRPWHRRAFRKPSSFHRPPIRKKLPLTIESFAKRALFVKNHFSNSISLNFEKSIDVYESVIHIFLQPMAAFMVVHTGHGLGQLLPVLMKVIFYYSQTVTIFTLIRSIQPEPVQRSVGFHVENAYLRSSYYLLTYAVLKIFGSIETWKSLFLGLPVFHVIGVLPLPSYFLLVVLEQVQYYSTSRPITTKFSAYFTVSLTSVFIAFLSIFYNNVAVTFSISIFTSITQKLEFRKLIRGIDNWTSEMTRKLKVYLDRYLLTSFLVATFYTAASCLLSNTVDDVLFYLTMITTLSGVTNHLISKIISPTPFDVFQQFEINPIHRENLKKSLYFFGSVTSTIFKLASLVLCDYSASSSYLQKIYKIFLTVSLLNRANSQVFTSDLWFGMLLTVSSSYDVMPYLKLVLSPTLHPSTLFILWLNVMVIIPFFQGFNKRLHYLYCIHFQLSWGSIAHGILQPLATPQSGLTLVSVLISSIAKSPVLTVIGSTFALPSFPRLQRFWFNSTSSPTVDTDEQKYTQAIQPDVEKGEDLMKIYDEIQNGKRQPSNAIFYQVIAESLKSKLFELVKTGKFGPKVHSGCFFLLFGGEDEYTIIIHLIEVNSEYVNFQIRGLELKGTLCQQREVQELMAKVPSLERFPSVVHPRWMYIQRLRCWKNVSNGVYLDCYSLANNKVYDVLASFDARATFFRYIIYQTIYSVAKLLKSEKEEVKSWLSRMDDFPDFHECLRKLGKESSTSIKKSQESLPRKPKYNMTQFVETLHEKVEKSEALDEISTIILKNDESGTLEALKKFLKMNTVVLNDRDLIYIAKESVGRRKNRFLELFQYNDYMKKYSTFAELVFSQESLELSEDEKNEVLEFCLALSYQTSISLGLKVIKSKSLSTLISNLNAAFHGNLNIQQTWTMIDNMRIWNSVIIPGIKTCIGLLTDYFIMYYGSEEDIEPDEVLDSLNQPQHVYNEYDPVWRQKILDKQDRDQIMTFRYNKVSDGARTQDAFQFMTCTPMEKNFKLFSLNEEMVKSVWTTQEHELVYLQSTDSERGSVQYRPPILRNMIASSTNLPLGYPVYVSPIGRFLIYFFNFSVFALLV